LRPELRTRLYERAIRRQLNPAGAGRIRLSGDASTAGVAAVPYVALALTRAAARPDLAVALIAGHADDEVASSAAVPAPLLAVALQHALVADPRTPHGRAAVDAVRRRPFARRGPDAGVQAAAAAALEYGALASLAGTVTEGAPRTPARRAEAGQRQGRSDNQWDNESRRLADVVSKAATDADPLAVLMAAWVGDPASRSRIVDAISARWAVGGVQAGLLSPSGLVGPDGMVSPALTWVAVSTMLGVDALAFVVAEQFSHAIERLAATGIVAPAALTVDGAAAGPDDDALTAAVTLLLERDVLRAPLVDTTPARRGTSDDERAFLAPVKAMARETEVAAGLTAGELLDAHLRPPATPGVTYEPGVVYSEIGDETLYLHLFRPAVATAAPVALFVHGGGWENGNPAKYLRVAAEWASRGWVTGCVGYRLVPVVQWPHPLDDVCAALDWVADQADRLGADPGRIVLVGDSAGGHLSLLAAARRRERAGVCAVVALSPLTETLSADLAPEGHRLLSRLLGTDPDAWTDASPLAGVTASMPPVLSFVGSADTLTTEAMVRRYHDALDRLGVDNELVVLPGRHHAFEFAPADAALWSTKAWEWLSPRVSGCRQGSSS
jgi:acetyl esterase/lipase